MHSPTWFKEFCIKSAIPKPNHYKLMCEKIHSIFIGVFCTCGVLIREREKKKKYLCAWVYIQHAPACSIVYSESIKCWFSYEWNTQ